MAPEGRVLSPRYRRVSAIEVILGTFFVVGHNVLKIVPNEVYLLFALFWISFRLRDGGWTDQLNERGTEQQAWRNRKAVAPKSASRVPKD